MSYVLVRANKVVKTIQGDRPLTTAERANGGTRREVSEGLTIYIGGTVSPASGKITGITNPNPITNVQLRRAQIKRWLLEQESAPIAAWGLLTSVNNAADRARNTWAWLDMLAKASAKDSNLANNLRFQGIIASTEWNARKFFLTHNHTEWTAQRGNLPTRFHSIQGNGGLVYVAGIPMNANATEYPNFTRYLESL